MSDKIVLTRNQLAKFLPTPEAVKAFENLFLQATQLTPSDVNTINANVQVATISADTALGIANYGLSVLQNLSSLIESLEIQPPEVPTIIEDEICITQNININNCDCLEIIKEPDWNFIKNHPTTISGYGITDAYSAVVADAPLTGSGTSGNHLSIPAASAIQNGYLSSTDWGIFNGKQASYTNLTSIGNLANGTGWLYNNGSGTFTYSTPSKSDVGLSNVTNNAQVKAISSTDNAVVRFDGTSGQVQNSSVVIDDSGNVGIVVTPSGWNTGWKAIDVSSTTALFGNSATSIISNNMYVNSSGSTIYKNSATASYYRQQVGTHTWYTAPSGTAGNAITFTTAMTLDASGNLQFNSGYGSAATAYGCRAWVNFNGTGTVAIRASGNISSITDNGTGLYRANFATAMSDANYSVQARCSNSNIAVTLVDLNETSNGGVDTTNSCNIEVVTLTSTLADRAYIYVAVFR